MTAALTVLGVALAAALVAPARRGDSPQRRARVVVYVLGFVGIAWMAIDFVITPADRWVNGITLILVALAALVVFGYERFRRSKARAVMRQ